MDSENEIQKFSIQDLFEELKDTAKHEGVSTLEQFKDLVDDLVEQKRIYGIFSDDEDITQIKKDIVGRWPELEKTLKK
jgi:hypothetical protein